MSGHVVLLGDSIFDNHSYAEGQPDVLGHLRGMLPSGWKATLLAVDGNTTYNLEGQVDRIPSDASHLVVSIGGNNALMNSDILDQRVPSTRDALLRFALRAASFEADYGAALTNVLATGKPTTVCTIYNGDMPDEMGVAARTALTLFNDTILRVAFAHGLPVIDLRLICTEASDYIHSIEPSGPGGRKIAHAIAASLGLGAGEVRQTRVYAG